MTALPRLPLVPFAEAPDPVTPEAQPIRRRRDGPTPVATARRIRAAPEAEGATRAPVPSPAP